MEDANKMLIESKNRDLPIFLQFYDWFYENRWIESEFDDQLDWPSIGTAFAERGSVDFYAKQFAYIMSLGIDHIAWEYHARLTPDIESRYLLPSPNAIEALRQSGLKIAPTYDLEITLQVANNVERRPDFLTPGAIRTDNNVSEMIIRDLERFFQRVPRDLIGRDRNGDIAIFVFGFSFDDSEASPTKWSEFAARVIEGVTSCIGADFKFYWTSTNFHFAEHLFLHHRRHFAPFQFVSDMPQAQFSRDAVTWNFGFDNNYVRRNYNLRRGVRLDPRYIEETAWLAAVANPSALYIYGWNEPFEASMLFPTKAWGDTKARLAKHYLNHIKMRKEMPLPPTLIIVDDLDLQWSSHKDDWHLQFLREMLLYRMRLFAPQADVVLSEEVDESLFEKYTGVIDLTSIKSERLVSLIDKYWDSMNFLLLDPLGPACVNNYIHHFFDEASYTVTNDEVEIVGNYHKLTARDDTHAGTPRIDCKVVLWAKTKSEQLIPLVVARRNAVFVNSYSNDEIIFRSAFEEFYGRPMGKSILYGEGFQSQVLIQLPDGEVTYNKLSRYSVNLRLKIPSSIDWYRQPPDLEQKHFPFIFGLNDD